MCALILDRPIGSAQVTWNGAGADAFWSTAANWSGGVTPPNDGSATVQLAGSTRLAPILDVPWNIAGLAINAGASSFTLGGATLTTGIGGITNNATNAQTVGNAITLGSAQTVKAASGDLAMSGAVDNGGFLLTASSLTGRTLTFSGAISGAGGLTKAGAGALVLSGANTYSGQTTVSAGTLRVSAGSVSHSAANMVVDTAALAIESAGTVASNSGWVGNNAGTVGTATVSGAGSQWTNSANLIMGRNGSGTLTISNGGNATNTAGTIGLNAGSNGSTTVTGTGSAWVNSNTLIVGGGATGTLAISDGGSVTAGGAATIGNTATGNGTVTVSGTGSTWSNQSGLRVGYSGTGALTISNGGSVANTSSTTNAVIGFQSGSSGTVSVDGAGSTLSNSSILIAGYSGTGALTIGNGGTVVTSDLQIANGTGSSGSIIVTGPGTTMTKQNAANAMLVGLAGTGSLAVTSGGAVTSASSFVVGLNAGSTGNTTVSGTGSTLASTLHLTVGYGGTGNLAITSGGTVTNGSYARIGGNTGSQGTVTVDGAGSSWHDTGGMFVGYNGNGSLAITNGGSVRADLDSSIGYSGTGVVGSVIVDGTGSTFQNLAALKVGDSATGSLTLSNRGAVIVGSGGGTVTLGANIAGIGKISIGGATEGPAAAAGNINAALVTTGAGTGTIYFNTTATPAAPYYLTADGSAGGTAVAVDGATQLVNTAGYNVLTAANTHIGGTTVTGGTLVVNNSSGSGVGSGVLVVHNGATLAGSGFVGAVSSVRSGAHIAPGNSAGTLTFTNGLTLDAGAILDFQLGLASDRIVVSGGTLTGPLSGAITLNVSNAGGFAAGTYALFDFTGAATNSFDATDFTLGTLVGGTALADYSLGLAGSTLTLTYSGSAIPEPAESAMILAGMTLGWCGSRRRRSKTSAVVIR